MKRRKRKPTVGLTPKQQRFVDAYIKCRNAKQAAIQAGYAPKTAESHGPRLARNGQVKEAIDKAFTKASEKAIVDVQYVIEGLREVAQRCLQREPVMRFDYAEKAMVQDTMRVPDPDNPGHTEEVGVWEFDSNGANRAFELLGKYLRMFVDQKELSGPGGKPLIPKQEPAKLDVGKFSEQQLENMGNYVAMVIKGATEVAVPAAESNGNGNGNGNGHHPAQP